MEEEKSRVELYSELNVIRSMSFDEFFGAMDLTEEQIDLLIEMAEEFEEDYLFFITWMEELIDKETTDYKNVKNRFSKTWSDTASKYLDDEQFIMEYSERFADNAVESTLRHVTEPWYFSPDRATFNAENEALTVFNRGVFLDAIEQGYTRKTWQSLLDGRERHTHMIADGQTVGMFELFEVGAAHLLYPRDVSDIGDGKMHPREIVSCRCFLTYS